MCEHNHQGKYSAAFRYICPENLNFGYHFPGLSTRVRWDFLILNFNCILVQISGKIFVIFPTYLCVTLYKLWIDSQAFLSVYNIHFLFIAVQFYICTNDGEGFPFLPSLKLIFCKMRGKILLHFRYVLCYKIYFAFILPWNCFPWLLPKNATTFQDIQIYTATKASNMIWLKVIF
jgi:hypothetical protein